jgi:hypothetical protein
MKDGCALIAFMRFSPRHYLAYTKRRNHSFVQTRLPPIFKIH